MHEIELRACSPEPLSNYIKALGVLRLVAEQKDAGAKGCWRDDAFVIKSALSREALERFFLHEYKPTPLVSPWNGSTGFWQKDNKATLDAIARSSAERLYHYRVAIAIAKEQVEKLGLTDKPTDADKRRLVVQLRNTLPDESARWLDTCTLLAGDKLSFPPLTGTGGNDGNFEFSRTFMQQLMEVLDLESGRDKTKAAPLLKAALFAEAIPGLEFSGKIGQFNPIAAGGSNASPGFQADSRVNPWDYILMIEGTLLFTAGATRRYETEAGSLAYPFTVRPSSVGYASAAQTDEMSQESRGELWLPLWAAPAGVKELELLFREGRAKVGKRSAKTGVDFARAIASLGVARGIDGFARYGFQVRNGLSYFAIPLGRFKNRENPQVNRLSELDGWLNKFLREAKNKEAPASIRSAARRLETAIFELAQEKKTLLDILIALGEVEKACDRTFKFTREANIPAIPTLQPDWVDDCDDGSVEFRLAFSLAGKGLRQRLVKVREARWSDKEDGMTIWQEGALVKNLIAWVRREEVESEKSPQPPKLPEPPFADLGDIAAWIEGNTDDDKIEAIARGLSLLKKLPELPLKKSDIKPPSAYALLALIAYRGYFNNSTEDKIKLPKVPGMLAKLAAGDCLCATEMASRRLHASGFKPAIRGIYEPIGKTLRIAAALAFPISRKSTENLLEQVQIIEREEEKSRKK